MVGYRTGVDFVDLATKRAPGVAAPALGDPANAATLNGYAFYFLSAANAAAFAADPWRFAPAYVRGADTSPTNRRRRF